MESEIHEASMSQIIKLAVGIVGLVLLIFPLAHSEPLGSVPEKELKLSTSHAPLTPFPEASVIAKDADWVVAEIERRERDDKLIRQEILEPHRRPDHEYDVVNGIQSLNAARALHRP